LRAALGCSDRGYTAASQLKPGDLDWDNVFRTEGARWFHCGGVFASLSESTAVVAREAMEAARRHGAAVSYDLNYRPSLWASNGGKEHAQEVNRALVPLVDVLFGNEEDFSAALGFDVEGLAPDMAQPDTAQFGRMMEAVVATYPDLKVVAATLRGVRTATRNDWGALCRADGKLYTATPRPDLEILDRVGGGDSFASGFIYGLLTGQGVQRALDYGVTHGALAMTTPGDTSMVTLAEVERVMRGTPPRVTR
jgi:2-dehydro-3-deoxygluconokinase